MTESFLFPKECTLY